MRKAKNRASKPHTAKPIPKKREEITSAELEIIEQSERNFEIGSVGNGKSFKGFEKKLNRLKVVF